MTLGTDSNRECPSCGREMSGGLTTYTGEPPECAICQGQTVIGDGGSLDFESELFEDEEDRENYEGVKGKSFNRRRSITCV